jgi:hypothetical protein
VESYGVANRSSQLGEDYIQEVVARITRALNEYRRESELFESEKRALLLMEKLHNEGLTIVPKRIARRTRS